MSRSVVVMLVSLLMLFSCIIAVKPALSSAQGAENSWASKAPMPTARSGLGVSVVSGKIYAIGGVAESEFVGANEQYDVVADTWTVKLSMPTPRAFFAVAAYRNKIYCIGGAVQVSTNPDEDLTKVNEVYDPATDTWETKAAMPMAVASPQASVLGGKIYLIGGGCTEVYDPASDTWSLKSPMPEKETGGTSAVFNGKIYFFVNCQYQGTKISSTQIYDPASDTWNQGTSPPLTSSEGGATGVTTGIVAPLGIYVFLGSQNLVYDPLTDSWSSGADMPTSRSDFGIAVVNDLIYVVGGYSVTYPDTIDYSVPLGSNGVVTFYSTVEQYTPFGYGTVPPLVSVASPENKSYASGLVSLNFSVSKPVSWVGYSLDGNDNVTIAGNATLSGLSNGAHNVTVYAKDGFGNTASETVWFTLAEASFPAAPVAAASGASVAVVGLGLLVYFRKRNH